MISDFSVLFGGEAGYGTMSAGTLVAKAATRHGLWAVGESEFPSLIKGGLNTSQITISEEPVFACEEVTDFLGVVSQPALDFNLARVKPGGIVLFDSGAIKLDQSKLPEGVLAIGVDIAGSLPGDQAKVMANAVLLGAFSALSGFPRDWLREALVSEFADKPEIAKLNGELFDKAYSDQSGKGRNLWHLNATGDKERILINGNDAIALGALTAGVKFAAGYPMTPGTSVLIYLADHGAPYGLIFKQAEDELAAMNMLIGASYSGARAMGSTSGGGFALMTEALGFAGIAELPITMVVAQRGGPSTGLPTRTMQADLKCALYASQGEFPRIIMAPGDVQECFHETFRTVNWADQYQLPAIILTDKDLADSMYTTEKFNVAGLRNERKSITSQPSEGYKRYLDTFEGVSPRTLPGTLSGGHIATSYTHQEDGFYSSGNKEYAAFEPEVTRKSIDKLYRKFATLAAEITDSVVLHGPKEAEITLVGWGSTKGAILEALKSAKLAGTTVNFLQVRYISPFPTKAVEEILSQSKRTLLVEGNATGQLGDLIRVNTGIHLKERYLKYDGKPFTPSGIWQRIQEVLVK